MKGRYLVLIFVAVLVIIYLAVFLTAPDDSEQVATDSTPEVVETVATPDFEPAKTPEPTATKVPVVTKVADVNVEPAEPKNALERLDPNNTNQLFLGQDQISDLIEKFGAAAVYQRLYYYNRQEMLDVLFFQQNLRENASDLLALEEEVPLRLQLIESLEPSYVPRESDSYDPEKIDHEFLKILEAETKTPMTGEEWNSRLVLAGLVSDEAALDFARRADQLFPEDDTVELVSSSHMLMYESERAPLSAAERTEASDELARLVTAENYLTEFNSDLRLMGYRAIAGFSDTERAITLLEDALDKESDQRLRDEIEKFIAAGAY